MREFSEVETAKIKRDFDYFDSDQNGTLNVKEFVQLFKVIAPEASTAEAKEAFGEIDSSEDGAVDFDEFLDWWGSNWSVY